VLVGALGWAFAACAVAAGPIPRPPDVDVRAYILVDFASGRQLAGLKEDEHVEPASITKLMTAYAVFTALKEKRLRLDEDALMSEYAWRTGGAGSGGSTSFIPVNARVPVEVLIKGMIIQSGNDATIALAEKVGGTEPGFVQIMNTYAKQLGMKGTNFANSTGLPDPQLYTTPRDIATLSAAIIREFPEYYKYYSMREFVWNGIKQQNRNGLLERDPSVDGIKTGHTESAGYCLATSANRQGMRLISVVFGAPSMKAREDASAALLNYGYTFYETVKLRARGDTILKPRLYKGAEQYVPLGPARDLIVTLPRGASAALKTAATAREPLIAPLPLNKPVGEMTVSDGNDVIAKVPLFPVRAIAEGGIWTRLSDTVSLWFR
jgi:D-alanyl-D-alanine carboxypeptidase (penicillin-binding protein 5/6)